MSPKLCFLFSFKIYDVAKNGGKSDTADKIAKI